MQQILFVLTIVLLFPTVSHAHILSGESGFLAGLCHPVLGFDHFLAMLSVGILSAQMGGRAIWSVPLTFVAVMAVGAILGSLGVSLIAVEYGIAFSVLVLGISLAMEKKLLPFWAMIFVGFFALFHGHAHGTEMPTVVKPLIYGLGFILGTAGIHLAGVSIGVVANRTVKSAEFLRFVGAGISGIGVHIIYILIKY